MAERVVVVADHNFPDLAVERAAFDGIARIEEGRGAGTRATREQLLAADAVLVRMQELDAETVAAMDRCRVISRYGIGVDHIAVETAAECGIHVANAPTYCVEEVALHAVSLLFALARRLPEYDDLVAAGDWKSTDVFAEVPITRLSDQRVGIVGFGRIGKRVAEYLDPFGVDVLACDPSLEPAEAAAHGVEPVGVDALLERADYVTIHAPLTEETRGSFDAEAFAAMKESACLVNTSRGPIVDTDALVAALDAGELRAAGLDVFPTEPPAADDPVRGHDRILVTPHVAYFSTAADLERREQAIENVLAVFRGERPPFPVNDPRA